MSQGRSITEVLPLVFTNDLDSAQPVSYAAHGYALEGYVSTPPLGYKHKLNQYLYINNRYVHSGQAGKQMHSWFKAITLRLQLPSDSKHNQRQTPSMYPAFALQLSCAAESYRINRDADKVCVEFADWSAVRKVLQVALVQAWSSVASSKMLAEAIQHSGPAEVHAAPPGNRDTIRSASLLQREQAAMSNPRPVISALPAAREKDQHPPQEADFLDCDFQDDDDLSTLVLTSASNRAASLAAARCRQHPPPDRPSADSQSAATVAAAKHCRPSFLPRLQSSAKMKVPIRALQADQVSTYVQLQLCAMSQQLLLQNC